MARLTVVVLSEVTRLLLASRISTVTAGLIEEPATGIRRLLYKGKMRRGTGRDRDRWIRGPWTNRKRR
jgi:hypothetical protein